MSAVITLTVGENRKNPGSHEFQLQTFIFNHVVSWATASALVVVHPEGKGKR